MVDTDAIRARHHEIMRYGVPTCGECASYMPCDALALCDALDAANERERVLREENTRLRAANEAKDVETTRVARIAAELFALISEHAPPAFRDAFGELWANAMRRIETEPRV